MIASRRYEIFGRQTLTSVPEESLDTLLEAVVLSVSNNTNCTFSSKYFPKYHIIERFTEDMSFTRNSLESKDILYTWCNLNLPIRLELLS